MLKRLIEFFEGPMDEPQSLSVDEAAAVLLIEVMMADHDMDQREHVSIVQILSKRMGSSLDEAESLVKSAFVHHEDSIDHHSFVTIVNAHYDERERFDLLVDMWRVAFADGHLDKYEDHRIRRISELMHLHHSHFIQAKAKAQTRD